MNVNATITVVAYDISHGRGSRSKSKWVSRPVLSRLDLISKPKLQMSEDPSNTPLVFLDLMADVFDDTEDDEDEMDEQGPSASWCDQRRLADPPDRLGIHRRRRRGASIVPAFVASGRDAPRRSL